MNEILTKIHDIGIIPVIAIDDASKAVPLAEALVRGGLPAAEVTFRTEAAEEAIIHSMLYASEDRTLDGKKIGSLRKLLEKQQK